MISLWQDRWFASQAGGMRALSEGLGVMAHEPSLIWLSELMVEHPGLDMTRSGFVRGWFY